MFMENDFLIAYRRLYPIALQVLGDMEHDDELIAALVGGSSSQAQVKKWMRGYGLFQGIRSEARERVAATFLDFHRQTREPHTPSQTRQHEFKTLLSQLHACVPRGWLSATSKLLWCMHPNETVIFDAFVLRSVLVLQHLVPDLIATGRHLGLPPVIRHRSDVDAACDWYWRYANKVTTLHKLADGIRKEFRGSPGSDYPYAIRITDKVLWIMGSPATLTDSNRHVL